MINMRFSNNHNEIDTNISLDITNNSFTSNNNSTQNMKENNVIENINNKTIINDEIDNIFNTMEQQNKRLSQNYSSTVSQPENSPY